ncbi:hypothetical protein Poli38472_005424 [Pythium oligandrum]|uniref:Anoctamin transmembrane domain-containing protein n=1 Tax=Pythium oligandrum TaxID=41045 RepID=A0A8K1FHJ7_PYTOL|nr:hypothetical protein Poli38472_005424 [Pythium oligandrum]|eukprot:TMW62806.1 hypothetical protein Poli38472_005424 [Pythium oligandrum]
MERSAASAVNEALGGALRPRKISVPGPNSPPRHTALHIHDQPSSPPASPRRVPRVDIGLLGSRQPFVIDTAQPPRSAEAKTQASPVGGHGIRQRKVSHGHKELLNAVLANLSPHPLTGSSSKLPPPLTSSAAVLVRRKPPPVATYEGNASPKTPKNVPPPVLFFQDIDSEETVSETRPSQLVNGSSSHQRTEPRGSSASSHDSTCEASVTSLDDDDVEPKQPEKNDRHASQQHIGKLGELSREEDEYDFAILLRPSKYEEHLDDGIHDEGEPTKATPGSPQDFKPAEQRPLKRTKDMTSARQLIIQRITRTGLQVKRLLSLDGRQTLLKVKAPQHVLELGAERMRLRKLRKFDRIWMEFAREVRETFEEFDPLLGGVRFLDSEKQCIVHLLLTSDVAQGLGAGLNEFCPLKTKYVLKMYPLHKQDLTLLRKHWVTYWKYEDAAAIPRELTTASLPAPLPAARIPSCTRRFRRLVTHPFAQPIDQVAQYYGERVAYYFAWMEMYTRWLVVPSIVGLILFILQVTSKTLDHPLASIYAIFMALWTSAFLIAWKHRAATLAYRWGTLGYEDEEVTRPEFYGDPAVSTDTTKRYPSWKRYVKYVVTIPSVLVSIVLVLILTLYVFSTRDRLEAQSIQVKAQAADLARDITKDLEHGLNLANLKRLTELGMDWDFWFYFLITPMLYGLLIPMLDYIFTHIARRMTNWENHRTETHYQSHLILKVFSFRFVHVFASLYYYAFAHASRADNLLRMAIQLASIMITDQVWRNVMQTLYPFIKRRRQAQRKKKATNAQFEASTVFNLTSMAVSGTRPHQHRASLVLLQNRGTLPRTGSAYNMPTMATTHNAVIHEQCVRLEQASDKAWEEAELEQYDTFEDYTEMLIQFGYVTFFSLAFPLAPLLALCNNTLELRIDAFKLCHAKQRPIAQKASGIGIWFQVLQLMSVLAVLTNCLHIAFTTTLIERVVPSLSPQDKVWIVFGVEHLILALKVWMMVVNPSMPTQVHDQVRREREHAKIESARAMASKLQAQQQPVQPVSTEGATVLATLLQEDENNKDDGESESGRV